MNLSSQPFFKLILKGIIHKNVIQIGIDLGLSKEKSRKVAITTGKKIIKLARDILWKPRCDTQIAWEKANNIFANNKKRKKLNKPKYNPSAQIQNNNSSMITKKTKTKRKLIKDFLNETGIHCICGIEEHNHKNTNCNIQNKLKYLADLYTKEIYIGFNKSSKVIYIDM